VARSTAAHDDSPIPRESTERVLGNIRDFAGGKPSPNILYSTHDLARSRTVPHLPRGLQSCLSIGQPRAHPFAQ
jgi:hypothetical protein